MATTATPIKNSQTDIGSKSTNKIPIPNPTKHTAIVFFKNLNIKLTSNTFTILY